MSSHSAASRANTEVLGFFVLFTNMGDFVGFLKAIACHWGLVGSFKTYFYMRDLFQLFHMKGKRLYSEGRYEMEVLGKYGKYAIEN